MKKNYLTQFKIPVVWNLKEFNFEWQESYCINRTEGKDKWPLPSAETAILDKCFEEWNVNREGTKHYHSHIANIEQEIFNLLPGKNHLQNFLKLTPGNVIPWHYDTFRYYIKTNNVNDTDVRSVHRILIFVEDWKVGQIVQFGKKIVSHWKAGDCFTWNRNLWHGACNFGNKDLIMMQVNFQM